MFGRASASTKIVLIVISSSHRVVCLSLRRAAVSSGCAADARPQLCPRRRFRAPRFVLLASASSRANMHPGWAHRSTLNLLFFSSLPLHVFFLDQFNLELCLGRFILACSPFFFCYRAATLILYRVVPGLLWRWATMRLTFVRVLGWYPLHSCSTFATTKAFWSRIKSEK